MMHNAQENDDKQQACCDPAPQTGGSCCGAAAASADYPYGTAEYVTGTLDTPGGPSRRCLATSRAPIASAPGACAGASAATTTA